MISGARKGYRMKPRLPWSEMSRAKISWLSRAWRPRNRHGGVPMHEDRRREILAGTGIDVATAGHFDQLRAARWEMEKGLSAAMFGQSCSIRTIAKKPFESLCMILNGLGTKHLISLLEQVTPIRLKIIKGGHAPASAANAPFSREALDSGKYDAPGTHYDPTWWKGKPLSQNGAPTGGAVLSTLAGNHTVTTSQTSNAIHMGGINVDARGGDLREIADNVSSSLERSMMTLLAQSGQA